MQALLEVISAAFSLVNLPFTILLILVLVYWASVIAGFLTAEDADLALDMDGAGGNGGESAGFLKPILHFLRVGEAPIMLILSVLVLCLWALSLIANHFLNPGGALLLGLALLIPILIVSAILTRILTKPLRHLFYLLNKDYDKHPTLIGQVCVVTTSEANASYGQATIETRGAPLTVHIRVSNGVLRRGDRALIIEENKENRIFQVVPYQEPQLDS